MNCLRSLLLLTPLLYLVPCAAQNRNPEIRKNGIQLTLINDTLFSDAGFTLYKGQQLVVNEPSVYNYYRSIQSRYTAIVPEIWGKNRNFENQFENYVDSKKNRAAMKLIVPGTILTIEKFALAGERKSAKFYIVLLKSGDEYYKADIALAFQLKELSIPK